MRTWSGTTRTGHAGTGDDQRNADGRVVDEEAVLLLAVIAQYSFAVIAGDGDKIVDASWPLARSQSGRPPAACASAKATSPS